MFIGENTEQKLNLNFQGKWLVYIPAVHPDGNYFTYKYIDIWSIENGIITDGKQNRVAFKLNASLLLIATQHFFINEIRDKGLIIYNLTQTNTTEIPILIPKTKRSKYDDYSGCYILVRSESDLNKIFFMNVSQ